MKGQGSVMQVMVGVLVVSVLLLFLFIVRTNTSQESISALGETAQTFRSRVVLNNLDAMTIKTHTGEKLELGEALSYTCSFSSGSGPEFIDNSHIENIVEEYLNQEFGEENYVLQVENCFLSINTGDFDQLEGEKRIGTSYVINLVNGETSRVVLYL